LKLQARRLSSARTGIACGREVRGLKNRVDASLLEQEERTERREQFRVRSSSTSVSAASEAVGEVENGSVASGSGGGRCSDRRRYRNDPLQQGSPHRAVGLFRFLPLVANVHVDTGLALQRVTKALS
jgi:hypothetical protein